ncbi:MAG: hypothetical protein IJ635_03280, partial [Bacteroidaceae bacterium]|nr:hypothetical protein [Bacteroidaceae bacterium]
DQRVRFIGTYGPLSFSAENKSILMMGAANTLYYPLNGASIGAQRAYFLIGDDATDDATEPNAQNAAARLTAFNINFGDSEATGIISIENGKLKIENDADAWYSLDGRKLQGKPLYILIMV